MCGQLATWLESSCWSTIGCLLIGGKLCCPPLVQPPDPVQHSGLLVEPYSCIAVYPLVSKVLSLQKPTKPFHIVWIVLTFTVARISLFVLTRPWEYISCFQTRKTLLLSTSATALNKKEILFWPWTEISSKEIIYSASSVIFMKI